MLSEEEKKEIFIEMGQNDHCELSCLEALKIVQKRQGWVSDEAIRELARLLSMTPEELDSIATFYPFIFRRPVGKHVIYLCDTLSCWVMGYENLLAHLIKRLGIAVGQTTPDGRFTLLPVSCIGACDQAPAMLVDDDLHGNLTPDRIDGILEQYT